MINSVLFIVKGTSAEVKKTDVLTHNAYIRIIVIISLSKYGVCSQYGNGGLLYEI